MKTIFTFFVLLLAISTQTSNAQPGGCQASFTYTADSLGNTITFTNTSVGNYTNVIWNFGDGTSSTAMNPVHTYNSFSTYWVSLTIFDSLGQCQSTDGDSIYGTNGGGTCSVSFGTQGSGLNVYFYASINSFGASATYTWDFGDGSTGTGQFPQHSYAAAGSYYACVTATTSNGCTASYCDSVVINSTSSCSASFNYNQNGLLNSLTFTNTSVGSQTYFWDFGDNSSSTSANPTHQYNAPGTYTVCLTIGTPAGPCYDTYCTTVTVTGSGSQCDANFGVQNVGLNYMFYPNNSPNYYHSWSFGDGTYSYSAFPTHPYAGPGTYYVCHTVVDSLNQCVDTYCDSIVISSGGPCSVSFTYTADSTGLAVFSGTASGVAGNYIWTFGDGTSGTGLNATHQYNGPGIYVVCLNVTAQGMVICSYCDSVVVGAPNSCVPVFYSYPDSNVIGNGNVNFGVYSPCGNTQYVWSFGDGTSGSGPNPVHNYADSGWYYVCVTAFTPSGNFQSCDSVYALRLGTAGIAETALTTGLNIYPNPATDNAAVQFALAGNSTVQLSVTDIQGKVQSAIYNGELPAGKQKLNFSTSELSKGVYMVILNINGSVIHQRLIIQ